MTIRDMVAVAFIEAWGYDAADEQPSLRDAFTQAIQKAVEAEREACATLITANKYHGGTIYRHASSSCGLDD